MRPDVVAQYHHRARASARSGELVASTGQGQAVELKARALTSPRHGGPGALSAAEEEAYAGDAARAGPSAHAVQHFRRGVPGAQRAGRARSTNSSRIAASCTCTRPMISASDAEGAGSMFQVTTLDLDGWAQAGAGFHAGFLRQAHVSDGQRAAGSGDLRACAFANVYTFGPTFRAENSNTPRHLAEFYMIEPEMAFCDLNDNQDLAEAFLKSQVEQVVTRLRPGPGVSEQVVRPGAAQDAGRAGRHASFERITYTEAIALLQKSGKNFEFSADWGVDMQSEHERYLTEEAIQEAR